MLAKINHGWRWLGTALSFFVFSVGGVLLSLFVAPLLYVLPGGQSVREQRAQRVIHYSFKSYIRMMRMFGVISYELKSLEKLNEAKLIIANHPSLIDVVFLISMIPNANCIVKGALVRNPCIHFVIKMSGYIINRDAEDLIASASAVFSKGQALIVFPEGTRTVPSQPIQLKRGAANIAVRTNVDITPVIIECNPSTLTKQDRWYQVPNKKVRFHIEVKDPIKIGRYLENSNPSKAARKLTHDLSHYFNMELE